MMLPLRRPRLPAERPSWSALVVLVAPLALPLAAAAHGGHSGEPMHGLIDGVLHPFTGIDHLAAMLAVGAWTGRAPARRWIAPLAFALALVAGATLAMAGRALPSAEPMIAASLLIFGLLLASRSDVTPAFAALLVGGFGLFHGAAHGLALASAPAIVGMVLGSAALQAAGVAVGLVLARGGDLWARAGGTAVAGLGGALLLHAI